MCVCGESIAQTNVCEILHTVSCLVKKSKRKVNECCIVLKMPRVSWCFVFQNLSNAILGLSVFGTDVTVRFIVGTE